MTVTRLGGAIAFFIVCSAILGSRALIAPAIAQPAAAEPHPERISQSQFRANPELLDRHPMEVDNCRLVEH